MNLKYIIMITNKEKDLLIDVIEFYVMNKLKKDSDNISVFMDLARETGDLADSGDLYTQSKPLHDLKHKLRNHVDQKIVDINKLRNKLLNL